MFQIILDFFSGKAKTRIYSTFLGWFIIFHLDIIFISILTDQELVYKKTGLLKGEYLWNYLTSIGWWAILIEIIRILFAAGITYLMIWKVPKFINEKSYKEELDIEFKLRMMKVLEEEKLNKREEKVVNKQLENIQAEKQVIVERARVDENPEEIKWSLEFKSFIKLKNAVEVLLAIRKTIYGEGGNLKYYDNSGYTEPATGISSDNLAMADTNGLIEILNNGNQISLTEKGKFFLRQFSNSSF